MKKETKALLREITPYELATLAARVCPQVCQVNQPLAIGVAQKLMREAEHATVEERLAELNLMQAVDYRTGLKLITGRDRMERAENRLAKFLHDTYGAREARRRLNGYKKNGFTRLEAIELRLKLEGLQEPLPKGKQGHRLSIYDQRLKVEGRPIAPRKPQKLITLTPKEKSKIHDAAVKHGWKEKLPSTFAQRSRAIEGEPGRGREGDAGWTTAEAVANRRLGEKTQRKKARKSST